jgi:hypothetical protein
MSNDAVAFLTFITLVGGFVLLFPVVRALSERLKGRADPGLRDEVQALREDLVTELQLMRQQMGELTDRVEFTERLIAKQRVAQRVGPGE